MIVPATTWVGVVFIPSLRGLQDLFILRVCLLAMGRPVAIAAPMLSTGIVPGWVFQGLQAERCLGRHISHRKVAQEQSGLLNGKSLILLRMPTTCLAQHEGLTFLK